MQVFYFNLVLQPKWMLSFLMKLRIGSRAFDQNVLFSIITFTLTTPFSISSGFTGGNPITKLVKSKLRQRTVKEFKTNSVFLSQVSLIGLPPGRLISFSDRFHPQPVNHRKGQKIIKQMKRQKNSVQTNLDSMICTTGFYNCLFE